MEIAKIQISGVSAKIVSQKPVPAGIIGATISVEYTDPSWNNLSKTVVFTGCGTKDVLSSSNVITVPAEVVAKPGYELQVSFYGVGENQQLAVPTLRVSLGKIKPAARPSGDSSTDPSLPVWAQLQQDINALKESSSVGGGGESGATYTPSVSEDGVLSWTNDKGLKNPPSVVIMGKTGPQGPKGDTGENGVDGADGYTPVRGTDYWTDADKAEMTDYLRDNLTAEDVGAISNNGRNVANANIAFGAITNGLIADGTISATKLSDDVFSGIVKSVNGNAPDENGNVEVSGGTSTIQPLTFTGAVSATYDGSEAVSVEIPQGGSGSSSGGGNTHIYETKTTLTEAVTEYIFNLPCAAQQLKEFSIVIVAPSYEGNTSATYNLYLNAGGNVNIGGMPSAGSIVIRGTKFGDYIRVTGDKRTDQWYGNIYPYSTAITGNATFSATKQLKCICANNNVVFPVGTILMFWGLYNL